MRATLELAEFSETYRSVRTRLPLRKAAVRSLCAGPTRTILILTRPPSHVPCDVLANSAFSFLGVFQTVRDGHGLWVHANSRRVGCRFYKACQTNLVVPDLTRRDSLDTPAHTYQSWGERRTWKSLPHPFRQYASRFLAPSLAETGRKCNRLTY